MNSVIQEDADALFGELQDEFAALQSGRVLITGAAGFLCSYLLDVIDRFNQLRPEKPIKVIALDNFRAALPERIRHLEGNRLISIVEHDVTKPFEDGKFDWIIHGASVASPIYYRQYPIETIAANVNGTWRMLELAEQSSSQGILYLSSSEIYGNPTPDRIPTSEDYVGLVSCTGPRACYDESKRLGETLTVNFVKLKNVKGKIVRPFNVYGPGQRLNDQRIVPDLMNAALKGGPILLFSDGRPTRSFCYVRDFMAGMLRVLVRGTPGEPYNVGTMEEVSILQAARTMAEVAGRDGRPLEVRHQQSCDRDYLVDNPDRRCPDLTKISRELGYEPKVSLAEGFKRTYRSYQEAGTSRLVGAESRSCA